MATQPNATAPAATAAKPEPKATPKPIFYFGTPDLSMVGEPAVYTNKGSRQASIIVAMTGLYVGDLLVGTIRQSVYRNRPDEGQESCKVSAPSAKTLTLSPEVREILVGHVGSAIEGWSGYLKAWEQGGKALSQPKSGKAAVKLGVIAPPTAGPASPENTA